MVSKKTIISVSSAALVVLVLCSIILPLFLSYKPIKKTEPVDVQKFFNDEQLHDEWGESYNLVSHIPKKEILFELTNYNYTYSIQDLKFDKESINKNLLSLMKSQVLKDQKYLNENNLYIQVRYRYESPESLLIDSRWTNKNNYITLYYNRVRVDIDI